MSKRRLVSIRRWVPLAEQSTYRDAWSQLHAAAAARGAHAWHFASTDSDEVFLEFLEFGADSDIRADPAVLAAIQHLHATFGQPHPPPKPLEEWVEA